MDSEDIPSLLEELLPGIPNDITLDEIATKLPWENVISLSSQSQTWQQAINSRVVYNARVRCNSTGSFVVLRISSTFCKDKLGTFLYPLGEKRLYELPPVPNLGDLRSTKVIALDGKLYVVGGISTNQPDYQAMHVLDLAGHMQWKQCASMLQPRQGFMCGAMNGKVYVFGGVSPPHFHDDCGSEVYDPKVDAWFPIKPMVSGHLFRVISVGDELFVAGSPILEWEPSWQVYHSLKDEWKQGGPSLSSNDPADEILNMSLAFGAQGKFFSITADDILVYDTENNSWAHWCSMAYDGLGPSVSVSGIPHFILPVSNELLAVVNWKRTDMEGTKGWFLIQSRGFSSNRRHVVWSQFSSKYDRLFSSSCRSYPLGDSMCFVQL